MGVSYQTGALVRTGEERATLVRRTYALVLVSVLVTIVGVSFALSQPAVLQAAKGRKNAADQDPASRQFIHLLRNVHRVSLAA